MTPSFDAHLIARLGCRPGIQRVHVGDTRGASAIVALPQAWNHLGAFPADRVLMLAVETCSAAYYLDDHLESAVAHAIFGDGAGAAALSTRADGASVVCHRTLVRSEQTAGDGLRVPRAAVPASCCRRRRRIGAVMMKEMAQTLIDAQGLKPGRRPLPVLHSAGRHAQTEP